MKLMCYVSYVLGVIMLLLFAKGICYSFENAGICYWFSTQKKTFYEAKETCENMNGKLAQLHDQAVFEMITGMLTTSKDQFWVGLNNIGLRAFRWENKALPESSNWRPEEPNGSGPCVRLCRTYIDREYKRHLLADQTCNTHYHFICQKRHEFGEFSISKGTKQGAYESHCPLTSFRRDGSRLKCAKACIMEPKCVGFVYKNTVSTCTMLTMSLRCPDDMREIAVTVIERQCSWNTKR